jgi:hypothetical protein
VKVLTAERPHLVTSWVIGRQMLVSKFSTDYGLSGVECLYQELSTDCWLLGCWVLVSESSTSCYRSAGLLSFVVCLYRGCWHFASWVA